MRNIQSLSGPGPDGETKLLTDKHEWVERKGQEVQEAANRGDMKALFRIVRKLTGERSGQGVPIKDKTSRPLVTKEKQDVRWVEHFRETLNQQPPEMAPRFDPDTPKHDLAVNLGDITVTETTAVIRLLKKNKRHLIC